MADYAIHDTTLTGISNVIRKKDGTSALIDPADYPKRINLMGMLEEKTVSSSPIVTFPDGADAVPLKKCEITLPASLDGYTEVDVVSASKNFLDDSIITKVGGNIYFGGATSATTKSCFLPAGTYTITLKINITVNVNIYMRDIDTDTNITGFPSYNAATTSPVSKTFTLTKDTNVCVFTANANYSSTDNVDFCQIEAGTVYTTYEPFISAPTTHTASLGRTIYGGTVDVVNGQGESTFAKGSKALSDFTVGASVGDYTAYTYAGYITESVNNNNKQVAYIGNTQIPYIYQGIGANTTHFYIGTNGQINLYLPNDWSDFENDVEALAELATPETFTFDPVPIDSKLGNNTIWSEQGDTEVTYRADIDLALAQLSGTRGLMMASRSISPMIGEEASLDRENILEEEDLSEKLDSREEVSENSDNEESEEER